MPDGAGREHDAASEGPLSTLADYAISLSPWAGYVIFTNVLDSWRDGFVVGLAMSALVFVIRTIRHDSRFLDAGTLAYCAAMAALSSIDPGSPVRAYNLPLSMSAIGGISSASLAIKSPFTYRIARDHVPPAILEDPHRNGILYRAHVVATTWWAASQLLAAGTSALLLVAGERVPAIAVQAVGTLVPVALTRYQHERVAKGFGEDGVNHGAQGRPALSGDSRRPRIEVDET